MQYDQGTFYTYDTDATLTRCCRITAMLRRDKGQVFYSTGSF